ncbi:acetyl esterase [Chromohalobacter marismortui]|uniref:Acetyl esterase n=1 Tax=Chromohalobacter marismortui TaxID=42055 RepID=A0A4V3F470_9GAMM|nr:MULTISPECIES: alpha/beta hydrolase [Chromohalobacter]MCI0509371.1 alpha/beta hydrolase [Chromohalobacter sp.]MCI0594220.1 alpha/beta hydrolase [Chromohalobacter sp.]TDU23736.1 acetyl esterase [Chromohalobacter marismortui]
MTPNSFDITRLDPEVQAVLREMAAQSLPPLETLPIAQMREVYRTQGDRLGGEAKPMHETRGLEADGPLGSIPLRLYRPRAVGDTPQPATIYLHGGGWTIGDLESHDKICRRLAHGSGGAVIAVDYRLAPEHPAPAGPEDVLAAIRWIAAHAGALGLDASRLAVAGDSAGGGLAAMACQQLRGSEVALCTQVLFYPGVDLTPDSDDFPSRQRNGNVPPLTTDLMHALAEPFIGGYDTTDLRVSPLRATDFSGLPPALIVTAEYDALLDEGRRYRYALEAAGVPVVYEEVPRMVHGFIEMAGVVSAAAHILDLAAAFLCRQLNASSGVHRPNQ